MPCPAQRKKRNPGKEAEVAFIFAGIFIMNNEKICKKCCKNIYSLV